MSDLNKLRWRCRRGCLELDLLLMSYLDNDYPLASIAEQQAFAHLLELEDQTLLAYLKGDVAPENTDLVHIIENLRK